MRRLVALSLWFAVLSLATGCVLFEGGGGTSQLVTPSDGAYLCTSEDGAHVWIPPGALAEETTISIDPADQVPEVEEYEIVGPGWEMGPDGTQFLAPVTVTVHYDELPAGASDEQVSILSVSADGTVEELEDIFVYPETRQVSGTTTHFTRFYAFLKGPVSGGARISIGGPNLQPLFATGTTGNPVAVDLWLDAGPVISSDPYVGPYADVLVIQIETDPPVADSQIYVEGWVENPVDPGSNTLGPDGQPILTAGFWLDLLRGHIAVPLIQAKTDADGVIVQAIDLTSLLYKVSTQAPAGYPSGTLHLRVVSPDQQDSLEAYISIALSPLW